MREGREKQQRRKEAIKNEGLLGTHGAGVNPPTPLWRSSVENDVENDVVSIPEHPPTALKWLDYLPRGPLENNNSLVAGANHNKIIIIFSVWNQWNQ
jgi:hypothetical protein